MHVMCRFNCSWKWRNINFIYFIWKFFQRLFNNLFPIFDHSSHNSKLARHSFGIRTHCRQQHTILLPEDPTVPSNSALFPGIQPSGLFESWSTRHRLQSRYPPERKRRNLSPQFYKSAAPLILHRQHGQSGCWIPNNGR